MKATKKEMLRVYKESGLNGLYAYLRKNGIAYERDVYNFGLEGAKKAEQMKREFLAEDKGEKILRFHYYCTSVTARNGFSYNRLRGIEITIL